MRIGVDATAIPYTRSGAGNYVFSLLRGLAARDSTNEYTVFAKPRHVEELLIEQSNFRLIPVRLSSRATRLVWEQTVLPVHADRAGVEVLHSPHYTMPLAWRGKSVVTFHDITFQRFPSLHQRAKRAFFPAIMRMSAKRATRLIAVSESTRTDIIDHFGVAPDKVLAVPLAASAAYRPCLADSVAEACGRYGLTPQKYILFVGVVEPRKNLSNLVGAYAEIAERWPGVPLVIAGKRGWMYEEVLERVRAENLSDRVRFLGHVPEGDLPFLYTGARVFVYVSRYEGFGLPVLEAMQCGTPVITSSVSSMPEVAGGAALLVDPDDVSSLSRSIDDVLADDRLAGDLARRGLERAKNYSWDRCAEQTVEAYESVR